MTANQLKYQQNQEAERANKQREREDRRRNRAAEDLKREDQRIQKVLGTAKVVTDAFGNLVQGGKAIGTLANDPAWYEFKSGSCKRMWLVYRMSHHYRRRIISGFFRR